MQISLSDFLAAAATAKPADPPIAPEGQVARLREAVEIYTRPNPFRVGDLVTPRGDAIIRDAGKPHIVVDLGLRGARFDGDPLGPAYGRRLEIRVMCIEMGRLFAYWAEHHQFEFYTGPGAENVP